MWLLTTQAVIMRYFVTVSSSLYAWHTDSFKFHENAVFSDYVANFRKWKSIIDHSSNCIFNTKIVRIR